MFQKQVSEYIYTFTYKYVFTYNILNSIYLVIFIYNTKWLTKKLHSIMSISNEK